MKPAADYTKVSAKALAVVKGWPYFHESPRTFTNDEPVFDPELGVWVHPLATMFPKLGAAELAELVADIAKHGMTAPIIWDGAVLVDGRNRFAAVLKNPDLHRCHFQLLDELLSSGWSRSPEEPNADPVPAFIISRNLHRRHLTSEDKARVLAEIMVKPASVTKAEKAQAGKVGGKEGGRGRKKPLSQKPDKGSGGSKATIKSIVAASGGEVSRDQAADAAFIISRAKDGEPAALKAKAAVANGQPLKEARAGMAQAAKPKRTAKPTTWQQRAKRTLDGLFQKQPKADLPALRAFVREYVNQL